MIDRTFFQHIYRMDDAATLDFLQTVKASDELRAKHTVNGPDVLKIEYLSTVGVSIIKVWCCCLA